MHKIMDITASGLSEALFDPDPFLQFKIWFDEHSERSAGEINAFVLSSSETGGRVSSRVVLLKDFDHSGFVFYTNYSSKKGRQLSENPFASMLFYWPESRRQLRIEGRVLKTSSEASNEYFHSRPRESQLSAKASPQSSVIPGRSFLTEKVSELRHSYDGRVIDRPENWGGYRLIPDWFEFWQEGENRLHDRITYDLIGKKWELRRLAP